MYDLACPAGHVTVDVWARVGERPACPTCGAPTASTWTTKAAAVAAVTWPGGKTFENLGHTPQTFYAPSELSRYLKTHHLESFVRHVPLTDSDKSPHTVRWTCTPDLAGATAMLERMAGAKATATTAPPSYIASMVVTTTQEGS